MRSHRPGGQGRCLLVMLRHPEAGRVKTRLADAYGGPFAAELYGHFVDDLLEEMERGDCDLELLFTPADREAEIQSRFGKRFSYTPQRGDGLGERMENGFRDCFANGFSSAVLIGSDFPDLGREVIEDAFAGLERGADSVVGPASDGGYYLIGFRRETFAPAVFPEMPWGSGDVFDRTAGRLRAFGHRLHLAPVWHDIDTPRDLEMLQSRHRDTPFGQSRTLRFLRNRPGKMADPGLSRFPSPGQPPDGDEGGRPRREPA